MRHSVMEVRAVPSRSGISREVSPVPERTMTLPLRRERDAVVVRSDELGDPDAGVEQQPADGAVAGEGAAFDGAQVALLLAGVQGVLRVPAQIGQRRTR